LCNDNNTFNDNNTCKNCDKRCLGCISKNECIYCNKNLKSQNRNISDLYYCNKGYYQP
jgi:hypothetical protein